MENAVAIITARGGSKRIPRKNIRPFLGRPIIQYSIDTALSSGCFEEVMVSTDDLEIAETALSLGAKVPFMRSSLTAGDFSTTAEVLLEVLEEYMKLGRNFTFCCGIYPTAPFLTGAKLKSAFEKLKFTGADAVIPVVRYSFPIQRSFRVDNGVLKMNFPEYTLTRSQDLPASLHDSGQFYLLRSETFLEYRKLFPDLSVPFELDELEVQDIDTEEDWKLAELKYRFLQSINRI
jgi:pseudaminic acid cytidylyltransferase